MLNGSFRKKEGIVQQLFILLLLLCGSAQSVSCDPSKGSCKTCASDSDPAGKWWYPSTTGGHDNICDNGKYYNANTGTASNYYAIRGCCGCPKGKYFDMEDHSSSYKVTGDSSWNRKHQITYCDYCPGGWQTSSIGSSKCSKCNTGQEANGDKTGCEDCPIGKYNDVEGTSCELCPSGKSSEIEGGKSEGSCNTCAAGTFMTSSSSPVTCTTCAAGKYRFGVTTSITDTCTNCGAGKYIEADQDLQYHDSESKCKNCDVQEESTVARDECRSCLVGKYQDQKGDGACKTCEAGK